MTQKNSDLKISRKRKLTEPNVEDSSKNFNLKNLSKEHILQCISAVSQITQKELKEKNLLLADDEVQPIFIQVTCMRVPKTPNRQMRILLPYSIVAPKDEVALFVCDLQKGKKKDYEPTTEHYRNLLDEHKCTRVNEIIPMNRVRTEYDQFELKRRLIASYDHFLVDGRIAGHICHLLGKQFFKKRKLPTSVRIDSKDLKREIDHALRKTSMHLHSNGDTHLIQIGNTSMSEKKILKNILAVCKNLSENYPGGWPNIRALRLKTAKSAALPFYISLSKKNDVDPSTVVVQPKRPKAYQNVEDELSTFLSKNTIIVKPGGEVLLKLHEKQKKQKSVN
ncbi:ribosomal L1 domain-containing protein CG13096 [Linepithema humile]|uniref:ribosomal L1 domain-containing protein CG13096 n=1 Tax=Linepithema humile TaxID=83485 RepID=UPI0006236561|nr:PREDICTED: ribosomal L1 domain-containing protein CG13096-like [Linepithema humile]